MTAPRPTDPIAFANRMTDSVARHPDRDGFSEYAPQDYAEMESARDAFECTEPHLKDAPVTHPYQRFLEATMSLYVGAHSTVIRDGVAAEQFRQSSLSTRADSAAKAETAPPTPLPPPPLPPVIATNEERAAKERTSLNDPFVFVREVQEFLFYSRLCSIFIQLATTFRPIGDALPMS